MRNALRSFPHLLFCVMVIVGAQPASAAVMGVAGVRVMSAAIEWPDVEPQATATLSIQGPNGEVRTRSFAPGKSPQLRLEDLGERDVDGSYTWELHTAEGVQSGSFAVANGVFVEPDVEPHAVRPGTPSTNDQTIPDDLIVQGSLCVGVGCITNEAFGFRTLVLKEDNLRISMVDTSSDPFPTTDWTFTFNDSVSGGANYIKVTDSSTGSNPFGIEGGARSATLWIDSTGRVGIGTTMAQKDLHILTGDTPAIRLDQNTSGGYGAYTWDIGANEANFFIRDETGGSHLPFRIRPGAPTSSIDIQANGNVGLNCVGAASDLVIASGGGCSNPSSSLNAGDAQFTVASSRTFKENLAPVVVPDVLDKLQKIDVFRYDFIDGPKDRIGLIAEDFHEVFARGSEKYIDGNEVQMALWLAVQQLVIEKAALAARVEALEKKQQE